MKLKLKMQLCRALHITLILTLPVLDSFFLHVIFRCSVCTFVCRSSSQSATYVSCLLAVEGYWPEVNGVRNALTAAVKQMEAGDLYKMQELALWVNSSSHLIKR